MLSHFTVSNYKSIKEEITLNLQATKITEHKSSRIKLDNEQYLLPLAAIYGPNGSGKSNILESMYAFINKLMSPICASCDLDCDVKGNLHKMRVIPFKFDDYYFNELPTTFEVGFNTEEYEYVYTLHLKRGIVVYENLDYSLINSDDVYNLFERNIFENIFEYDKEVLGEINYNNISDNLCFLSFLGITYKNIPIVNDVYNWLTGGIEIINFSNPYSEARIRIIEDEKMQEIMVDFLQDIDIDIKGFRYELDKDGEIDEIYTQHEVDGNTYELPLPAESSGTIKLFGLIPSVLDSLASGSTLVIDELDSKVHPKLLGYIIKLYRNPRINSRGAQLLFTSHDLMTMTNEYFRRDEIWFVAKTPKEASQIYSLVEFVKENGKQVRKDEKYGKQYLEGRYGADPYLRKMLCWDDEDGEKSEV